MTQRRWRLLPMGLVAATAAALLAACSGGVDAGRNGREPIAAGARYVAFGDSYVSGPALGTPVGPAPCQRTSGNYPHLLAERLDLDLVDASCGGAWAMHLTRPQDFPGQTPAQVPPQIDSLTSDTRLVTLSFGANDTRTLGTIAVDCAAVAQAGTGLADPCTVAVRNDGSVEAAIAQVDESIVKAVATVLAKAPKARVVVVGYPQLVPAEGTCAQLPIAPADYPMARRLNEDLADAVKAGAADAGAEYIDLWTASEGHDWCSADPWLAGVTPTEPATAFHPYAREQQAVADLIARRLEGGSRS